MEFLKIFLSQHKYSIPSHNYQIERPLLSEYPTLQDPDSS